MKATIGLELIRDCDKSTYKFYSLILNDVCKGLGSHLFHGCRDRWATWVAEILGFNDKFKYERSFLDFKKDYSKANSKGSRGVYAWYILESGKYYEIKSWHSYRNYQRYFAKINDDGEVVKVKEDEVIEWLRNQ